MAARVRLGELLVDAQIISREQLEEVLTIQSKDGRRLGTLLVEHGYVSETQVTQILSQQLSVPWVSLYHIDFSRQLLNLVSRELAEKHCLVPIFVRRVRGQGETVYVAMDDPSDEAAREAVTKFSGLPVRAMIAPPSDIISAIRVYYGGQSESASQPGTGASDAGDRSSADGESAREQRPAAQPQDQTQGKIGAVPATSPAVSAGADASESAALGGASEDLAEVAADGAEDGSTPTQRLPTQGATSAAAAGHPPVRAPDDIRAQKEGGPRPPPLRRAQAASGPKTERGRRAPAVGVTGRQADTSQAQSIEPDDASTPEIDELSRGEVDEAHHGPPALSSRASEMPSPKQGSMPRMVTLTLLDGTKVNLPARSGPQAAHPEETKEDQWTAGDLVAALRAVSSGSDASEILGMDVRWEAVFAALLSVLLRKHLIADWEFVDEYRKHRNKKPPPG